MDTGISVSHAVTPWLNNAIASHQAGDVSRPALHRYDSIALDNSQAIFGNVDNTTHHHHYPAASSNRRQPESNNSEKLREAKLHKSDLVAGLIKSLSYDGIWDKHSQIVEAHPGTCEWVLSDVVNDPDLSGISAKLAEGKTALVEWLQTDEDFFWIRGTAGSGNIVSIDNLCHSSSLFTISHVTASSEDTSITITIPRISSIFNLCESIQAIVLRLICLACVQ